VACPLVLPRLFVQHSTDFPRENRRGEGLLQELHVRPKHAVADDSVVGVARKIQHFGRRPLGHDDFGQLAATQVRHDHIGQQQVDRTLVLRAQAQSLLPVAGLQHRIAVRLQGDARQRLDAIFILDQQDRFRSRGKAKAHKLDFDIATVDKGPLKIKGTLILAADNRLKFTFAGKANDQTIKGSIVSDGKTLVKVEVSKGGAKGSGKPVPDKWYEFRLEAVTAQLHQGGTTNQPGLRLSASARGRSRGASLALRSA
jgi:hypothetical protein